MEEDRTEAAVMADTNMSVDMISGLDKSDLMEEDKEDPLASNHMVVGGNLPHLQVAHHHQRAKARTRTAHIIKAKVMVRGIPNLVDNNPVASSIVVHRGSKDRVRDRVKVNSMANKTVSIRMGTRSLGNNVFMV